MSSSDHVAYQRAVGVSLAGLAVQLVLGGALLVYSALTGDWAVAPVSYPVLLSSVVWVALALVFHQHKLERLEALEAEAFRGSDASAASVFEGVAADQSVQRNRLQWMHKFLLPGVSVAMAAIFVWAGFRVSGTSERALQDAVTAVEQGALETTVPGATLFAMAIGAVIAVVGFVFARFVAGMAKEPTWMLLNGGAGAAVGAALLGLLVLVAHFLPRAIESTWLLENLPTVVSLAMFVLGAEIALNFVANLYRPRQAGQYMRPAFDSRVLAYVAAPDRLAESISGAVNYQFGFNVSSTWFYRLLSRWVAALVIVAAGLVWAMTSIAVVEPDERGLLLRGGTLASEEPLSPGIVIKRPWPFDRVVRFPATAVNTLTVGTPKGIDAASPLLWAAPNDPGEAVFVVQPAASLSDRDSEGGVAARDLALVTFEVSVQYVVDDLVSYYRLAQDGADEDEREANRQALLEASASSVVTAFVSQFSIDEVLAGGAGEFGAGLQQALQNRFDGLGAGVEVVFAGLIGAHPGSDVATDFEAVVAADPQREAAIAEERAVATETLSVVVGRVTLAREIVAALDELDRLRREDAGDDAIRAQEVAVDALILRAGGVAAKQIEAARADRWQTVMRERGRAARIEGQGAAFAAAPRVYLANLFLQSLRAAASDARVMVVPPEVELVLDKLETAQDFNFGAAPAEETP